MQQTYAAIDALPALVFLLVVLGMIAVIWLAERVCSAWFVRRHRYDGLQDPRVLDFARGRVEKTRATRG